MNWVKCIPFVGTAISAVECVEAVFDGNGNRALVKLGETLIDGALDATVVLSGGMAALATAPGKIAGKTVGKVTARVLVNTVAVRAVVGATLDSATNGSQSSSGSRYEIVIMKYFRS